MAAKTAETLDANGVAEVLHRTAKTFRNMRRTLEAHGFPRALNIPGNPIWLKSEVDAWLLSRTVPALPPQACTAPVRVQRKPGRPRKMAGGAQ